MEKKGFWKQQFEFSNLEGEVVVVLIPLRSWKNWRNDFAIESRPGDLIKNILMNW